MGEFFRGWKRKIGLLTLVMALVFMAGWVRSLSILDQFNIPCMSTSYGVFSIFDRMAFTTLPDIPIGQGVNYPVWFTDPNPPANIEDFYSFKWQICGFGVAEPTMSSDLVKIELIIVPYWSIVIPMTLFSAFLLLSKTHKTTQDKLSQPATEKVG